MYDIDVERLLIGWYQSRDYREFKTFANDEREMMIFTNEHCSRLVKENEIWMEFKASEHADHFKEALIKSDEFWSKRYIQAH